MRFNLSVLFLCATLFWGCVNREIKGTVYIKTGSGESVRLSLVDVYAFKKLEFDKYMAQNNKVIADSLIAWNQKLSRLKTIQDSLKTISDIAFSRYLESIGPNGFSKSLEAAYHHARDTYYLSMENTYAALNNVSYYESVGAHFSSDFPPEVAVSKTDVNGTFVLNIPRGQHVLFARSSRNAGGNTELYYWVVPVDNKTNLPIELNNDNLFSE